MTIPLWMRAVAAIIILSIIAAICGAIHHVIWTSGFDAGEAKVHTEWKAEKDAAAAALVKENAATDRNQAAVNGAIFDLSKQYFQGEVHAKDSSDRFDADLRSGNVSLWVPTRRVASHHQTKDGADTSVACGAGAEARTELDPAAAADTVAITNDGDAAIRQLNKVIDAYDACRTACNAGGGEAVHD